MSSASDDPRRREAAFSGIRQWGDPILRTPTRAITRFDDVLAEQAAGMARLMDLVQGVGLAAPQVGSLQRLLVYRTEPDEAARALVNPTVESASAGTTVALEGCLSLGRAEVRVEVERAAFVVVRARDVTGAPLRIEAEDWHARVLQHEIDHLDGILMLQRAAPEQRREATRALREGRPWVPEGAGGE